ncbi:MAG TPA: hypothetical protein VH592_07100 [Gemmataceae bacterium]|jgi:tellurite resistance protein
MNALIRPIIVAVVLVPLAVCVFGLRFGCDSTDLRRMVREVRRREKLQQWRRDTLRFTEARVEVVRELIAQRRSLTQALTRLQELDREQSDSIAKSSKTYKRYFSDIEEHYQYIIAIAKGLLKDRPEEVEVVLCRLEKEYQQLQASRNVPSAMPTKRTEQSR